MFGGTEAGEDDDEDGGDGVGGDVHRDREDNGAVVLC